MNTHAVHLLAQNPGDVTVEYPYIGMQKICLHVVTFEVLRGQEVLCGSSLYAGLPLFQENLETWKSGNCKNVKENAKKSGSFCSKGKFFVTHLFNLLVTLHFGIID